MIAAAVNFEFPAILVATPADPAGIAVHAGEVVTR
jgi:hypothetical protein